MSFKGGGGGVSVPIFIRVQFRLDLFSLDLRWHLYFPGVLPYLVNYSHRTITTKHRPGGGGGGAATHTFGVGSSRFFFFFFFFLQMAKQKIGRGRERRRLLRKDVDLI